ncbi:LysR family transcriptional regulator [Cloacibacillus sp.]|uniref:LysR family transcriptional regulator n=1 Tax=Cloacibacillus sp. TaxID=2049023 RepID=UPI0025BB1053|nr:LysR family transcriptional regulator [Cloacibacillus sp.]MCC8057004.1 LysR family transcriptional regulator [Cloacibacillus sp.]
MELFQLRYFLTVAKYENFSKAAEELLISQPSISKAIKMLETELGVSVFERKGKRVTLNNAGKALRERLNGIMSTLDNLQNELSVAAGAKQSTIIFNVLTASSLLPDILLKFKKEYPLINFHLIQKSVATKFDLCITSTLPDTLLNNGILVLGEDIKLAVPLTSHFSLYDSVDLRDLRQENFMLLNKGYTLRTITSHFFDLCGYSPNIAFESDNPHVIRDLVEAGLGISLWPELSWGKIRHHRAKLLHIKNPTCRRNIFVTWPDKKKISPEAQIFLNFIKFYFQRLHSD